MNVGELVAWLRRLPEHEELDVERAEDGGVAVYIDAAWLRDLPDTVRAELGWA